MNTQPETQTQTQTQNPLEKLVFALITAKKKIQMAEEETEELMQKVHEYMKAELQVLRDHGYNILGELECKKEGLLSVECYAIIQVDGVVFDEINDNVINGKFANYDASARIHRIYNMGVPAAKIYFSVWKNEKYFNVEEEANEDEEEEEE